MELSIQKVDERAILKIGDESIEIKDYKISSSMRGGTELEVIFEFDAEFTEFLSKANSLEHLRQNR